MIIQYTALNLIAQVVEARAHCIMYRWLTMVLLMSWMMVLFVLVMFALTKATKCLLIM